MLSIAPLPCHLEDATPSGRDSVAVPAMQCVVLGSPGLIPTPWGCRDDPGLCCRLLGFPRAPSIFSVICLPLKRPRLQDWAATGPRWRSAPSNHTHSFPGFLCHRWSSPSASSGTSGHVCTVAQDTWLLILHLLLLQQKVSWSSWAYASSNADYPSSC